MQFFTYVCRQAAANVVILWSGSYAKHTKSRRKFTLITQGMHSNRQHFITYLTSKTTFKSHINKPSITIIIIIIISGLHHYQCVAPMVANSLQSGCFWARLTASVHDSSWESRSFCTVFIQVIRGRPGGLFQYTEGEEVKICLASILSSIRTICWIGLDAVPG